MGHRNLNPGLEPKPLREPRAPKLKAPNPQNLETRTSIPQCKIKPGPHEQTTPSLAPCASARAFDRMLALRLFLLLLSLPKRFPKQAKLGKVLDLVGLHARLQEVGDELFDVGRLVRLGGAVEGRTIGEKYSYQCYFVAFLL